MPYFQSAPAVPTAATLSELGIDAERFDALIRCERCTSVFLQRPMSILRETLIAIILCVVFWQNGTHTPVILWMTAVLAHEIRRWFQYLRFKREPINVSNVESWNSRLVVNTILGAIVWGMTAFIFLPSDHIHDEIILIVLVLTVYLGSMQITTTHIYSRIAIVILGLLPFVIQGGLRVALTPYSILVGMSAIIITVAIVSATRYYALASARAIEQRLRIQMLVQQLQRQNLELTEAREAAISASLTKSRFFAAASHDLRQPLHALGLFVSALRDQAQGGKDSRLVGNIHACVKSLDGLFGELLDVSKIDAGIIQVHRERFLSEDLLRTLADEFRPLAEEKGLELRLHTCGCHVYTDPVLLERILRNLLTNAIRYTNKGGVLLSCRCGQGKHKGDAVYEVWDTGIGIPADQIEKVYEEFYQVPTDNHHGRRGFGLGLSIVKRLARLLNYDISVASRAGRGTVFRFRAPQAASEAVAKIDLWRSSNTDQLKGKLAVVIDDDQSILDGMTEVLSGWGMDVIGSLDGEDVDEKVGLIGRIPDILIADFQLAQGRHGDEVLAQLRQALDPEIPVILVTGSTSPRGGEAAKLLHCPILIKPVPTETLRAAIAPLVIPQPKAEQLMLQL